MALHINIEDLLSARTVESDRIEYKKGWNPDAIYRSICAFANDFDNIGGGYIIIGVIEDEVTKSAKRPVIGLSTSEIAKIQKDMIGYNNLLKPVYHPKVSIESIDENQILIIWVPGGSNRPYQVPEHIKSKDKHYYYYIRKYANSIKANIEEQQELISLANNIPFDDRANTNSNLRDISMLLVKDYLTKINSKLADSVGIINNEDILGQMELIVGPTEQLFPRNVALMMFSDNPDKFFPYSQVEIVQFPNGDADKYIEHPPIKGPIELQIKRTLDFLKDNLIEEKVIKHAKRAESSHFYSYPYQAIEEIVVNCLYHRDYQLREPVEIRIYPNSIVFINQGGPERSIHLDKFNLGQVRSRRYRNRRLGEFLKELKLTEGRATGIPTLLKALKDNGSSPPRFSTDEERSYFEVELFIHSEFAEKVSITIDLKQIEWDIKGVDELLNQLINKYNSSIGRGKDEILDNNDNQADEIFNCIDISIVSGIVSGIVGAGIEERYLNVLKMTLNKYSRTKILSELNLSNSNKNFETYIQPLVALGWLNMSIPDKPTSPKQSYLTTLKGRLLILFITNTN